MIQLERATFVEPSTGCQIQQSQDYLSIRSIWNHEKLWVNNNLNYSTKLSRLTSHEIDLDNREAWMPFKGSEG